MPLLVFVTSGLLGFAITLIWFNKAKRQGVDIQKQSLIFALGIGATWTISPLVTLLVAGVVSKTFLAIWLFHTILIIPGLYIFSLLLLKMLRSKGKW